MKRFGFNEGGNQEGTTQENDHNNLIAHLAGVGVQMDSDLQFVTLKDIKDNIPLIAG